MLNELRTFSTTAGIHSVSVMLMRGSMSSPPKAKRA